VESECTVPHDGEYRRLTIKETRRQCKRQARPNGTGDGIDQPPWHLEERLTPLRKLAAVADQNGLRITRHHRLKCVKHLGRMELAGLRRGEMLPIAWTLVDCRTRFSEPSGGPRRETPGTGNQHAGCRNTVGDCTDQQPFAFLSRRTGDETSIGVDGD